MNTTTRQDAEAAVYEAITASGVVTDPDAEFDMDTLLDDLHDKAHGWDFTDLDTDLFWATVQAHSRNREEAAAAPEPDQPTPESAAKLDELWAATRALENANLEADQVRAVRDRALREAWRTGAFTKLQLAETAQVTRRIVYRILGDEA